MWQHYLNEPRAVPQIHPPVPNMYRYLYPEPLPLVAYPTVPVVPAPRSYAPAALPVKVKAPKKEVKPKSKQPQPRIQQPLQEEGQRHQPPLPKLTIEKVKSLIKPIDRHSNHEIPLPKQLEPYFGTGWVCRYYHATPAWGFIPPKGIGVRRADGFKALMTRLEVLDFRQKKESKAEEVTKVEVSTPPLQDTLVANNIQHKSVPSSHSPVTNVNVNQVQVPNSFANDNMYTYNNPPERYTPYFIYFLLENMRLIQERNPIHIHPKIQAVLSNNNFHDPREHPRPEKYRHCTLPSFWYLSQHRDGVEAIMKNHLLGQPSGSSCCNILEQWRTESDEVRSYCEMLAMLDQCTRSFSPRETTSNKRKRVSESDSAESLTSIKVHPNMLSEGGAEWKTTDEASTLSSSASSSPSTVPVLQGDNDIISTNMIFKGKRRSCEDQDLLLPQQVTFETKSSGEEGSTADGPPKKRFLHLSRNNQHDASSGIGLLAHVASML